MKNILWPLRGRRIEVTLNCLKIGEPPPPSASLKANLMGEEYKFFFSHHQNNILKIQK